MKKLYTPPLFVILILSVMMLCLSCDPNNTPKTFTVTYDANGGKGTIEPAHKTAKEAIVIANADSLSREGFTFSGWNTKEDGTGTSYAPGDRYEEDENLTLYAQWKAISPTTTYTLSFEYDEKNCYAVKCVDKSITSCVIPTEYNGLPVKIIRGFGFNDCTQLSSITIPESITTIGNWAFQSCSSLTTITLPNGVSEIFAEAFGCSNLESIYLPRSLKTIGRNIFPNCPKLKNIYYEGSPAEWNQINKHEEWDIIIKRYNDYEIHYNSTKK